MHKYKSKVLSLFLILTLFVGVFGVFNTDTAYAASKKIHVKKKTVTLVVGKKYQQKLIAKNGKKIKATKVKWKSKNPKIAKINKKGKITAVKAGTAKMTAKYKGKTYKFTVKVKKAKSKAVPAELINDMANAKAYADYMEPDIGKVVYYNFFNWDGDLRDYYASEVEFDLQEAKSWLTLAQKITKREGYSSWNSKLYSLIAECNALINTRPDYSSMDAYSLYGDRVIGLGKDINALYKDMGGK